MNLKVILCLVMALASITAVKMPILMAGNKNMQQNLQTQDEMVTLISDNVSQEKAKKVVVFKILTPSSLASTVKSMRSYITDMPHFNQLFRPDNSFTSLSIDYDFDNLVEQVARKVKGTLITNNIYSNIFQSHGDVMANPNTTVEVITTPLAAFIELEKILRKDSEALLNGDLIIVVAFKEQNKNVRILSEQEQEVEKASTEEKVLSNENLAQDGEGVSSGNYMSNMKPSSLWALIVSLAAIFIIYCGLNNLFGIKTPISFIPRQMVVGKES